MGVSIGTPPLRGYAICTEPRSGSNLLCRLLASTGVLGRPSEYFNADAQRRRGYPDFPVDPEAQLQQVPVLGATANGVYGLKMFSANFDRVQQTRWAERLPSLSFISLVRLDALGQAISHVRAIQTGQWTSSEAKGGEPVYDFDHINRELVRLLRARTRWAYFLARNDLPVLHLEYERLVQAPEVVVADIARFMGVSDPVAVNMDLVNMETQRDALSDEWRARFRAQARDLSQFH